MPRKKILFVVNNFNIGGPQKSLLSLLYRLNYEQLEVSLLSLNGNGALTNYLPRKVKLLKTPDIVKYATLSPNIFFRKTVSTLFSKDYIFAIKAIPMAISGRLKKNMTHLKQKYWLEVSNKLPTIKESFDVAIGVSGGHSMMFITDCVTANKRIGWIRTDYRVLNRNYKIDAKYFKKMDSILSVSEMCKKIFVDIFPSEENKIQVMYNLLPFEMYNNIPADTKVISEEQNHFKLLSISRLDPNKGLDIAIGALELLLNNGYKVKWYVLGDGAYRKELEKLIFNKGLQEYFILLGFHINTAAFMQECDVVVHPSRFEGKSNVIDEAKYLLKPIVATNFNTVNEQLNHKENGLISDVNSKSLALYIQKLLEDHQLKDKFKKNLYNDRYDDQESLKVFYNIIKRT